MAKAETASNRAPRGTKPVHQAFFSALHEIPEAQQKAVARAALTSIREEMKTRSDKAKAAAKTAKAKTASKSAKAKTPRKTAAKAPAKTVKATKTAKPKAPRSNSRKAPRARVPAMPETAI